MALEGSLVIDNVDGIANFDTAKLTNTEMDAHDWTVAALIGFTISFQRFQWFFLGVFLSGGWIDCREDAPKIRHSINQ